MKNIPELWLSLFPYPRPTDNKYTRGHTVVVGGPKDSSGAARLAAMAALRTGSGLVTVACPKDALEVYASQLTSVMVKAVDGAAEFEQFISDPRITVVVVGPGCGVTEDTKQKTLIALRAGKKVVIDADALTVFQNDAETLFTAINASDADVALTPHEGEFVRLFHLQGDRLEVTKESALKSGAVVTLKGANTVIAGPKGRILVNDNAPATLATAGSGDVLSGIIAGLFAQGMPRFDAAAAGVWVHGECGAMYGYGLTAEDLLYVIPEVLNKLLDK